MWGKLLSKGLQACAAGLWLAFAFRCLQRFLSLTFGLQYEILHRQFNQCIKTFPLTWLQKVQKANNCDDRNLREEIGI